MFSSPSSPELLTGPEGWWLMETVGAWNHLRELPVMRKINKKKIIVWVLQKILNDVMPPIISSPQSLHWVPVSSLCVQISSLWPWALHSLHGFALVTPLPKDVVQIPNLYCTGRPQNDNMLCPSSRRRSAAKPTSTAFTKTSIFLRFPILQLSHSDTQHTAKICCLCFSSVFNEISTFSKAS